MRIVGIVRDLNCKYHDLPEENGEISIGRLYYEHVQDRRYFGLSGVSE